MLKQDTLQFIQDLKDNNNREWFQANQKRYEGYKDDYKALVTAFIEEMSNGDDTLKQLEFKDCSFRITEIYDLQKISLPIKPIWGYG